VPRDSAQTAADLNTVARFLAAPDILELSPSAVASRVEGRRADFLVLLGNSVLCTTDAVAAAVRNGVPEEVLIAGGKGHSTSLLRTAVRADPRYDGLPLDDRPEAEIMKDLLVRWHGLNEGDILTETQSTNCGANAEEIHALLRKRGRRPSDVLLVQDPTMQRRTWASFRRVWGEKVPPRFHNCPTFVPTVTPDAGTLVFERADRVGLWPMERLHRGGRYSATGSGRVRASPRSLRVAGATARVAERSSLGRRRGRDLPGRCSGLVGGRGAPEHTLEEERQVGPTDCSTDHQHDDLFKRINLSVTRVFQWLKALEERRGVGRGRTCRHEHKRQRSVTTSLNNLNAYSHRCDSPVQIERCCLQSKPDKSVDRRLFKSILLSGQFALA